MTRVRLRRLHVDGVDFTWWAEIGHVRGGSDCHRCIRVRVWGGGKNGRSLQADLLSRTWPSPWSVCATDGAYPVPSDIRALIRYGLQLGWNPTLRGGTFFLSERHQPDFSSPDFSLPDFLLTDRLTDPAAPDPTARVIHAYEQATRHGHRVSDS
ncbi:hypothetical protein Ait01nite_077220 [Actinoplanes italicus]|uniref:Uncharacterized protein n=2 Tax=Actinoplanes italicus TaxID=113567 RepID=A0A2T0K443_9ACTN|nr:integrase [Actinoplanes italicus]PRX17640.1 hypothetical protein CLV67_115143 [Actinoplanes italicus]GIE34677.1 hypothetical protein Ait01nite_077220 [Actinoplanes italicus]